MAKFLQIALFLGIVTVVSSTYVPCMSCKDPNEEYVTGVKTGEPTCGAPSPKPCSPVSECRCKSGFVRNNGVCIRPCDCPKACSDPNEEYVLATLSEPTCEECAPKSIAPIKQCRCKSGYVRNDGVCIKKCECPPKCKDPNEEIILATTTEATCDCSPKPCAPVRECRCKSGYVRLNGVCVKAESCPVKCKDPNEEYVLATLSEPSCDVPVVKSIIPVKQCRCKTGYYRLGDKCVKKEECPVKCNDPTNEEYVLATLTEPTCDEPNLLKVIVPTKECRCKQGLVRYNGNCIKVENCPSKCKDPVNEEFVLATLTEPTCDEPTNLKSITPVKECRCKTGLVRYNGACIKVESCPTKCPDPMNEEFISVTMSEPTCDEPLLLQTVTPAKECRCKTGLVRYNGACIQLNQCPVKCVDPNEEYVLAVFSEPTCDDLVPKSVTPIKECRCKFGYVRQNGVCIKPDACPVKCKDPFEDYTLALFSEPTCDDPIPKSITPIKECRCRTGYVRYNGACIRQEECPVKCASPNEEYILALKSEPCCDALVPVSITPIKECRCKEGFVRSEGVCIRPEMCPVKCPDPNAEYTLALFSEPTCDERLPKTITPIKECRCKTGFVRYLGKCITEDLCPVKCPNDNEEYILALRSEPTCDEETTKVIDPIKECRCKSGFFRSEGKCITKAECPVKCTIPFEEYVLSTLSEPTCDNPTPTSVTPAKKCRCKAGYVRHEGKCIVPSECPVKCADPNEEYIMALFSEPTCDNPIPKSITPVKECRCKSGFVRFNGACIRPEACPVKCTDPNEEYILASLSEPCCDELVPRSITPVKECRCKSGYVRNNGKCIKTEECPAKCKDPNEESILAVFSEPTCDEPVPKSISPVKECRCKTGFIRHNGACIKSDSCPVKCKGLNEEHVSVSTTEPSCKNPIATACTPVCECRCKSGFLRNCFGICVETAKCPCGANEVFSMIRPTEEESCANLGKTRNTTPAPGCMCLTGYVRDCYNRCIKKCDCH